MSKNKQTVQTLFKVGFIVGLVLGILMALTIVAIPFAVVCIISAVMSKKLAAKEEDYTQKELIIVLVLSFIGGNIVTAIGGILALIDMNPSKSESAPVEGEQAKEEKPAEQKAEGEAASGEKKELSPENKNELVSFILACCAVFFSFFMPLPVAGIILGLIALKKWKANAEVELTEQPYATFHKITNILAIVGIILSAIITVIAVFGAIGGLIALGIKIIKGLISVVVL